jgi:hypothetical protein
VALQTDRRIDGRVGMAVNVQQQVARDDRNTPATAGWRRPLYAFGLVVVAVGLFFAYLRLSKTQPMNADGASQALQAWDLLNGNVLLTGWTVSDVSFYTLELPILALAEAVNGFNGDAVHVCAAVLYTLLALLVAALAKSRSTGREAAARVIVALAVMMVPMAGIGTSVLLLSPDHTGTAVPLLLALLLVDRNARRSPGWLPYAVGAVLMAGQISDPLATYVGALPLFLVCAWRLWWAGKRRPRQWRGIEARLAVAAIASVAGSHLFLMAIGALNGFHVHAVPAGIANPVRVLDNLRIMAVSMAANFGAYFPDRNPGLDTVMGVGKLLLLVLTSAVIVAALIRLLRQRADLHDRPGRFADELLVIGIGVNLGAFVVSTIPFDVTSARQIAAVLFLGAALVGRTIGPHLATLPLLPAALAGLIAVYGGEFATRLAEPSVPHEHHDAAEFLEARGLSHGLGGFWTANNLTLQTSGRVRVVPVIGGDRVYGYRWLSKAEWYDASAHDARFIVIHENSPAYGTVEGAVKQFGEPVEYAQLGLITILVYDENLLTGLPAWCMPGTAPSMAECP